MRPIDSDPIIADIDRLIQFLRENSHRLHFSEVVCGISALETIKQIILEAPVITTERWKDEREAAHGTVET